MFDGEFDDEFLVPTKAPPPYPGAESPGKCFTTFSGRITDFFDQVKMSELKFACD